MAPRCRSFQQVAVDYPFMSCLLKVNTRSSWSKTVRKVLKNCSGVHSFKMDDNGVVKVSGTVDPDLLLKTLGKAGSKAEVQWLQFGECSNNLYLPVNHNSSPVGRYGSQDYHQTGNGYYEKRLGYHGTPEYQITYPHNHDYQQAYDISGYYCYSNSNYGYNNYRYDQQVYDHGRDYYHYGYDHGANQNQNENQIRYLQSGSSAYAEDIGCCRPM